MTAADAPRVGDLVRLVVPRPDGTSWVVEDVVREEGERRLAVGGRSPLFLDMPGRTVEILERALPPEPPVGSIVAAGRLRVSARMRLLDGLWYRPGDGLGNTWADVVAGLGRDLVVIRHGWGLR